MAVKKLSKKAQKLKDHKERVKAHAQGLSWAQYKQVKAGRDINTMTRDRKWITKQAESRVNLGYAGAERALNQQDTAARNLAAKRAADDKVYTDWLMGQHDKMVTTSAAAGQALAQQQAGISAAARDRYAGTQQADLANANDRVGGQASAAGPDAAAQTGATASDQQHQNAQQAAVAASLTGSSQSQRLATANAAFATGVRGQTNKALNDDLSAVAKDRAQLGAQKSKDWADTLTNMFNQNTQLAQANRDYEAAAAQLGIKAQSAALDAKNKKSLINDREHDNNLADQKFAADQSGAKAGKKRGKYGTTQTQRETKKTEFVGNLGTARGDTRQSSKGYKVWDFNGKAMALTPKNYAQIENAARGLMGNTVLGTAMAQQLVFGRVYDGTWQAIRKMGINPKGLGITYGGKVTKKKRK